MSGSEVKVPKQVIELLAADLDELMVSLVPTTGKVEELTKLMNLIRQL
jgi:hypothetical protein